MKLECGHPEATKSKIVSEMIQYLQFGFSLLSGQLRCVGTNLFSIMFPPNLKAIKPANRPKSSATCFARFACDALNSGSR